jgi:hypothetical protein
MASISVDYLASALARPATTVTGAEAYPELAVEAAARMRASTSSSESPQALSACRTLPPKFPRIWCPGSPPAPPKGGVDNVHTFRLGIPVQLFGLLRIPHVSGPKTPLKRASKTTLSCADRVRLESIEIASIQER